MRNNRKDTKLNPSLSVLLVVIYAAICLLKVTGLLQWSWWIVLAPLWLTIIIVLGIIAMSFISEWIGDRKRQ